MKPLHIFKIGGNIVNNQKKTSVFLKEFSAIQGAKILVHGGGTMVTDLANKLKIPQKMYRGRRITDSRTLDLTLMVYAGLINKKLVAHLQQLQCNAIGMCGADLNVIQSSKRKNKVTDFGFVGDLSKKSVNTATLEHLLNCRIVPVFSSITHNGDGVLLNTNADTIAAQLASSLSKKYDVNLYLCFDKKGVLSDVNDEKSVFESLAFDEYQTLKKNKQIHDGMLPKLENAFHAINEGVSSVFICQAENFKSGGTQILSANTIIT